MDIMSTADRSRVMSRIKGRDTVPELLLRRALYKSGYRYRINYGSYKIDIAFASKKLAVFIDGCFWHGCRFHSSMPKTNRNYWVPKLRRNIQRDRERTAELKKLGWTVLRFWEHDVKRHPNRCEAIIVRAYGVNA